MRIAIVGAGNVGKALAGSFSRAGHDVVVTSARPENAAVVAQEAGVRSAPSIREAAAEAEAVVLAVPYPALTEILDEAGESFAGKVIVDVTNPLTADYSALAVEGTSAAEQIQAKVPRARVVKALNTVLAARQTQPTVDGLRIDGFVAGDDPDAKAKALALVQSIGLNPVDAGPLAMARALEAMALLNITLQLRNSWNWQTAWKLVGPTQ
jgi:NADPH-dependent F420 reductase